MAKDYEVLNELEPKTVELHRAIFDEGYKQGYKDGQADVVTTAYEKGLNDAWECARKIACDKSQNGYSLYTLREIFGTASLCGIFWNFSAFEAIAKIKEYEEKQKADDEMKAGDEIESIYGTNIGKRYIFTKSLGTHYANVLTSDGEVAYINPTNYKKTGRHFDQIVEVMEQLKEGQDDSLHNG